MLKDIQDPTWTFSPIVNLSQKWCKGAQKGSHQYSASAKKTSASARKPPTFNRQSFDSVPLDWVGWKFWTGTVLGKGINCIHRTFGLFLCRFAPLQYCGHICWLFLQIALPSSKQIIYQTFFLQEFFKNCRFPPINFLKFPTKMLFSLIKTKISPPYKRRSWQTFVFDHNILYNGICDHFIYDIDSLEQISATKSYSRQSKDPDKVCT